MHLPELTLLPCRNGGLCGDKGKVSVFVRKELYYKPYLSFVFLEYPSYRRPNGITMGSLIV
ncbi:MAG: hypothetical protein D6778_03740 [Nitrospirae bacterium]|nr:MAG: hypothetical protein D6778_03740 [Nitrospirota bacterium]